MKKPALWFSFSDPEGNTWRVWATTRRLTRCLQKTKDAGPSLGVCFRNSRKIYVDMRQTVEGIYDTLFHEMQHAMWTPMGLPSKWEEDLIDASSPRMIAAMMSAPFVFPPIPPAALAEVRKS